VNKRLISFTALLSFAMANFGYGDSRAAGERLDPPITAREQAQGFRDTLILAKPKAGVTAEQLAASLSSSGIRVRETHQKLGRLQILEAAGSTNLQQRMQAMRASGLYEYVEPDFIRHRCATPNDPRFGEQWALKNTGQSQGKAGADIGATTAWDTRTSADNVIVAVLDTGIRATHEDLAANLWTNTGEIAGNGVDDDGNGYVDDVHGINALVAAGSAQSGNPVDDQGHGTAVASVIAAVGNNGKGMAGVAWQAKLMALKWDDANGSATVSNEIRAIKYAIDKGAKVINISYGGGPYSQAEYDVFKQARDAGIVLIIAAGNEGQSSEFLTSYPAAYLLDNIVAVANSTRSDTLATGSNYGSIVELAAPGTDITVCSSASDTEYTSQQGTSLAAPFVAGAAALAKAQFPSDTYRGTINRILSSVDPLSSLSGKVQTGGRLNVAKALTTSTNQPFNDTFAKRPMLKGDGFSVRGNNVAATMDAGEPNHAGVAGGASVWWGWTAAQSGTAFVETTGSSFDTLLAVYTGTSASGLAAVASNDDADGTTSRTSFEVTAGTTYQIAVDGKNGATGSIVLSLGVRPKNDSFANAVVLTGLNTDANGANYQATREEGEPAISYSTYKGAGKTVWFRWTAGRSGPVSFAVHTDSFTPVIAAYTGGALTALSAVDSGLYSIGFSAEPNVTYYLGIDTLNGETGQFMLTNVEAYQALRMTGPVDPSVTVASDAFILADSRGYMVSATTSASTTWDVELKGRVDVNTPAFGQNTVYMSTLNGLFAYGPGGTVKWQKTLKGDDGSSPAIGSDGTVYQHFGDGSLYALAPDGAERWHAAVPGKSYSSPSLGKDGTIFIGSDDHYLYALSAGDGSRKWRFDAGDQIYASPALDADGNIYVGTLGGKFFSIDPKGTQRWMYAAPNKITSSAAIAADGTVYFGCYDGKLYALSSTGSLKWAYGAGGTLGASSPALASNGYIYVGSIDNYLHVVNSSGSLVQKYRTGGAIRSSTVLAEDVAIFGSEDSFVYVIPASTVASAPWPMFRQNQFRTGRRETNTAPAISAQPTSRTIAIGSSTTLSVTVDGQAPLTFQWYLNGAAIPGATQSSYTITNATAASAGAYTVVITNSLGSVTSAAATVSVATASNLGHLVNLSARAVTSTGAKTLIVGLSLGGAGGETPLLIRGVGPALAAQKVPGYLNDPGITLFHEQASLASNDNWGGDAQISTVTSNVGAFAFSDATSKDAALVKALPTGGYTAHVTNSAGNGSGVVLAEFYDATEVYTGASPRLINISARAQVGTGGDVLIAGFVIRGATPLKVLVRAVGPSLAEQNVEGVLSDPRLDLYKETNVIQSNDNWGTSDNQAELEATMRQVGAFAIPSTSKDAAMVVTLEPGAYTAMVSGVGASTGVALVEVYEVR
jgi:subtilisin family serine protease/outer membrane protein assembly factor BamB